MRLKFISLICILSVLFSAVFPNIAYATSDNADLKASEIKADNVFVFSENGKKSISVEEEIYLSSGDAAEYNFSLNTNGVYNLKIYYRQNNVQFANIPLDVKLDNKAVNVSGGFSLEHLWCYEDNYVEDAQGNQIAPVQYPDKSIAYKILNKNTQSNEPYEFELSKGTHTFTITALEEDVYICSVVLLVESELISYDEYIKTYKDLGVKNAGKNASVNIQGEDDAVRSEKSILIANERGSVAVEPYHAAYTRYNVVGGENWSKPGSYIEWKVKVPESGFYSIAVHAKQSSKINDNSYRTVTVDGYIPFEEAKFVEFAYSRNWEMITVGGDKPYLFYFSADEEHTVRLTASTGTYAHLIESVSELVARLNDAYLNILMITGSSPDTYRDYRFEKVIPDTLKDIADISSSLKSIEKEWIKYTEGGASLSDIQQMYQLLDKMTYDCDTIASRLSLFNSYISALQVWIDDRYQQPLTLDYICLYSPDAKKPEAKGGFFRNLYHHFYQFVTSFTMDYSAIGNQSAESDEKITVWLGADAVASGRDQAQIVTRLVNNNFTQKNDISVNVQLVPAGSLLTAVIAGIGPDVALGLAQGTPVNYALRNSIVDLSDMDGLDKVLKDFDESAYEPFKLEGGLYALPQTQSWPMLFYRKDILEKLEIPMESLKTWEGIKNDVIPILKINYLDIGISSGMETYNTLLYQKGGKLYSDDHMSINLDTKESISAFTEFTNLFLEHGLPIYYNFADRFRNGTMPLGIVDYTTFNTIKVYAPEIEGLWGMLPVPGTVKEDGTVDHSTASAVTGCGIFKEDNINESWEFIRWWVSTEAQLAFSQELEALLGTAGRNATANINARNQLGWSNEFRNALNEQADAIVSIPEIAGGYYVSRYFGFAFTDVVYSGKNVIETITTVKKDIDSEIQVKTKELLGKERKENEK